MEILVLLKQTFDTEAKISIKDGKIADNDVTFIINPYDEYAVEEAIKIRDAQGGTVKVISVGPDRVEEALRRALAMGADEAALIEPPAGVDEFAAAALLAAYIKQQKFDLILAGNMSVDTGAGQTALRVAEALAIAHISTVTKLEISGSTATATRDAEGDEEIVTANLPVLVTAQQGLNEPRYPSVPGIMKAKKKPLARVTVADLGVNVAPKTETTSVYQASTNRLNKLIKGSPAEQAHELVQALRGEAKVI